MESEWVCSGKNRAPPFSFPNKALFLNGYAPEKIRNPIHDTALRERVCSGKIRFALPESATERVCSGKNASNVFFAPFFVILCE